MITGIRPHEQRVDRLVHDRLDLPGVRLHLRESGSADLALGEQNVIEHG
jgi:hypothetical protein